MPRKRPIQLFSAIESPSMIPSDSQIIMSPTEPVTAHKILRESIRTPSAEMKVSKFIASPKKEDLAGEFSIENVW